ncbi:sensor histidine kinase [Ideonella sp.]|uniref:sensor histidine kinase n=1 Tax=Ideonella sp. TaxID=1929293 RepID=UPI002B4673D4|nr:histidine kinase [Ideonella sp.]HJV68574.1 histidine kinase [Ideonella sp.]
MADRPSPLPPTLRAFAARLLRHLAYAAVLGSGVGLVLAGLFRQHAGVTLVYSWCIALGCSISIDLLRRTASAWVHRRESPPGPQALADWPGWGWMSACLVLGTLIGFSLGTELANRLTGAEAHTLLTGGLGMAGALLMISLVPGVGATHYFYSRARLQAAQRLAAETRLKLLESQLEPHMLFNTLANLRALIALDPERAQAMLDRLIAYLRATLGASRAPLHPLSAEFARLADYLALMQVRMGDRLRVELELPPALAATPVPPLLLQPLVENAIKHGLEPKRGGGLIRVQALREAGELVLRVADTGVGLQAAAERAAAEPGTGFGLAQVRERLATLHGPAASISLCAGPAEAGGTVITLRWPEPAAAP